MTFFILLISVVCFADNIITIRTELYPHPPYSSATYYFYERKGEVVCTTLETLDKFDIAVTTYHKGFFKLREDLHDYPVKSSNPQPISMEELTLHRCLSKFQLFPKR